MALEPEDLRLQGNVKVLEKKAGVCLWKGGASEEKPGENGNAGAEKQPETTR